MSLRTACQQLCPVVATAVQRGVHIKVGRGYVSISTFSSRFVVRSEAPLGYVKCIMLGELRSGSLAALVRALNGMCTNRRRIEHV